MNQHGMSFIQDNPTKTHTELLSSLNEDNPTKTHTELLSSLNVFRFNSILRYSRRSVSRSLASFDMILVCVDGMKSHLVDLLTTDDRTG